MCLPGVMFVDCHIKTEGSWEWQPFGVGLSGPIKDQHKQGRAVDSAKLPEVEVNETHTHTHTAVHILLLKEETFNCPLSGRG